MKELDDRIHCVVYSNLQHLCLSVQHIQLQKWALLYIMLPGVINMWQIPSNLSVQQIEPWTVAVHIFNIKCDVTDFITDTHQPHFVHILRYAARSNRLIFSPLSVIKVPETTRGGYCLCHRSQTNHYVTCIANKILVLLGWVFFIHW